MLSLYSNLYLIIFFLGKKTKYLVEGLNFQLDEKFNAIRAKMRIRDREINELNHLSVKARRCQSEITHQQMWTKIV